MRRLLLLLAALLLASCSTSEPRAERRALTSRPQVSRVRTPIPLSDLRDALTQGFRQVAVTEPSDARISVAWAQMLVEHGIAGDSARAVWSFNLGNWDAPRDYSGPVFLTVPEHEDSARGSYQAVHVRPAFSTPEEGAEAWWGRMWSAFPDAFYVMDEGSADSFAEALHEAHYYTAPVAQYAAGLRYWIGVYVKRWPE